MLGLPGVAALGPARLLPARGGEGPRTLVQMAEMRKGTFLGSHISPGRFSRTFSPTPTSPHVWATHPRMLKPEFSLPRGHSEVGKAAAGSLLSPAPETKLRERRHFSAPWGHLSARLQSRSNRGHFTVLSSSPARRPAHTTAGIRKGKLFKSSSLKKIPQCGAFCDHHVLLCCHVLWEL